jgi:hypothetical protein
MKNVYTWGATWGALRDPGVDCLERNHPCDGASP